MLESLLADVLTRVLGQYVHGIDRDSIRFGVWGGNLELTGLALRPEALAVLFESLGLQLPVTVHSGFIGLLSLEVPWKRLSSAPVRVTLQQLTVFASPVSASSASSTEALDAREARIKRARLDTDDAVRQARYGVGAGVDAAASKASSGAASWGWSFTSGLLTKVADNIQFEVRDLIILFEDTVSAPSLPYTLSLSLDSLSAVSTNAQWAEAFVEDHDTPSIHKLLQLQGLVVDWAPLVRAKGEAANDAAGAANGPALSRAHSISFNDHDALRQWVLDETTKTAAATPTSPDVQDDAAAPAVAGEEGGPNVGDSSSDVLGVASHLIAPVFVSMRATLTKNSALAAATARLSASRKRKRALRAVGLGDDTEAAPPHAAVDTPDDIPEDDEIDDDVDEELADTPRVQLDVELPEVGLALDDVQYSSLLQTTVYFSELSRRAKRPRTAAERWRWALEQLLPGSNARATAAWRLSAAGQRACRTQLKAYVAARISLVRSRRLGETEPAEALSTITKLEEEVDVTDLLFYRELADDKIKSMSPAWAAAAAASAAAAETTTSTTSRIWSFFSSTPASGPASPPQDAAEDAAATADQLTAFLGVSEEDHISSAGVTEEDITAPMMRLGMLLSRGSLRLSRGGHPRAPAPLVDLSFQELRIGFEARPHGGVLLELLLGTVEARDLTRDFRILYPRVPWVSCPTPSVSGTDQEESAGTSSAGLVAGDLQQLVSGSELSDSDDEGAEEKSGGRCESASIHFRNGGAYPVGVTQALAAIRGGFEPSAEDKLRDAHSREQLVDPPDGGLPEYSVASEKDSWVGSASYYSTVASSFVGGPAERDTSTGSGGGDATGFHDVSEGDALQYLIAVRLQREANGEHTGRVSVEAAVGCVEAVVDGPAGSLVSALTFFQPRGSAEEPVLALLSSVAAPKLAAMRVELERTLTEQALPARLDVVIRAPRFILPGATDASPALVANLGTLGIAAVSPPVDSQAAGSSGSVDDSDVEVEKPADATAKAEDGPPATPRGGDSANYSAYRVTLANVGVFVAPSTAAAVSLTSDARSDREQRAALGRNAVSAAFSGRPTAPGRHAGTGRPAPNLRDRDVVERLVRPFSVHLSVQVLHDAKMVQAAGLLSLAKARLRGRVPALRLFLSHRSYVRLLGLARTWAKAMATTPSPSSPPPPSTSSPPRGGVGSPRLPSLTAPPLGPGESDGSDDAVSGLAALDVYLAIDSSSLELRDASGRRLVTAEATGTELEATSGGDNVVAAYRVRSFSVTDGSRGTTAAFRRLAHAGPGAARRGVSPPRSEVTRTGSEAPVLDDRAFVQVRYRSNAAERNQSLDVRFLSLNLVCVRETYIRVVAFFYRSGRKSKRGRSSRADMSPAARARSGSAQPGRSTSSLASTVGAESTDGTPNGDYIDPFTALGTTTGQAARLLQTGAGAVLEQSAAALALRGRLSVGAQLDGVRLVLAAAEGALATVDVGGAAMRAEQAPSGALSASGELESFVVTDLTASVDQYEEALVYRRTPHGIRDLVGGGGRANGGGGPPKTLSRQEPSLSDAGVLELPDNGGPESDLKHDGWSLSAPQAGGGDVWLRIRFGDVKLVYLQRFVNVLSQYLSLLQAGLQPALRAVEAASAVAPDGGHAPSPSAKLTRDPSGSRDASSSRVRVAGVAQNVDVILPRHSSNSHEALHIKLGLLQADNFDDPAPGYGVGAHLRVSGVSARVAYVADDENFSAELVGVKDKPPFMTDAVLDFRLDASRVEDGDGRAARDGSFDGTPISRSLSGDSQGAANLPASRTRLLLPDGIALRLSEAAYTVLYFVLTENLMETVDSEDTDFGKEKMSPADADQALDDDSPDAAADGARAQMAEAKDLPATPQGKGNSSAALPRAQPGDPVRPSLRTVFAMPSFSLTVVYGDDNVAVAREVVSVDLANVNGVADIMEDGSLSSELSCNAKSIRDRRPEGGHQRVFLSPLVPTGASGAALSGVAERFSLGSSQGGSGGVETQASPPRSDAATDSSQGREIALTYDRPAEGRPNIKLTLSHLRLMALPGLFRDLTLLTVPGYVHLASSAPPPDIPYLGRAVEVTLSNSHVCLCSPRYALNTRGQFVIKIDWAPVTGAKTVSMVARRLRVALTRPPLDSKGLARAATSPTSVHPFATAGKAQVGRTGSQYKIVRRKPSTAGGVKLAVDGDEGEDGETPVLFPCDVTATYVAGTSEADAASAAIDVASMLTSVNVNDVRHLVAIFQCATDQPSSGLERVALERAARLDPNATPPSEMTTTMSAKAARLLFTHETQGRCVPIMELRLRNASARMTVPFMTSVAALVSVQLFNEAKGWWEPGVEPWAADAVYSAGRSGSRAMVLRSNRRLDINLTPSTMRGALRVADALRDALRHNAAASDSSSSLEEELTFLNTGRSAVSAASGGGSKRYTHQPSVSAFCVRNQLGVPLVMWLPHDSVRQSVSSGEQVEVDLPADELVAAQGFAEDGNVGRKATLRCFVALRGMEPVELLAAEVGRHLITLWPEQREDAAPAPTPVMPAGSAAAGGMAVSDVDIDGSFDADSPLSAEPVVIMWDVVMKDGVPVGTIRSPVCLVNETQTVLEVGLVSAMARNTSGVVRPIATVAARERWSVPLYAQSTLLRVRPALVAVPSGGGISDDEDGEELMATGPLAAKSGLSHASRRAGTRHGAVEDEREYDWSSPLPPASWLRGAAAKAERASNRRQAAELPALPLVCRSLGATAAAFHLSLRPRVGSVAADAVLQSLADAQESRLPTIHDSWLDVALSAPLVLENLLPHPLYFRVAEAVLPSGGGRSSLDASVAVDTNADGTPRILAQGAIRPLGKAHVHSCGTDSVTMGICFAVRNLPSAADEELAAEFVSMDFDYPSAGVAAPSFGRVYRLSTVPTVAGRLVVEPRPPRAPGGGGGWGRSALTQPLTVNAERVSSGGVHELSLWSEYWIRNRSDVDVRFKERNSAGSYGEAVLLRGRPLGKAALPYVALSGPFLFFQLAEDLSSHAASAAAAEAAAFRRLRQQSRMSSAPAGLLNDYGGSSGRGGGGSATRDAKTEEEEDNDDAAAWHSVGSDLADIEKPVALRLPSVALLLEARPARGRFRRTIVLTVRNSAWIENRTGGGLQFCQAAAMDAGGMVLASMTHTVPPGVAVPVHWDVLGGAAAVCLRRAEQDGVRSDWIWSRPVPLNASLGEVAAKMYRPKGQEQYIARVVSVGLRGGSLGLVVYPEDKEHPPYRLVNNCQRRAIAFRQPGGTDRAWLVRAGNSTRYSWDDPGAPRRRRVLLVEVLEPRRSAGGAAPLPPVSSTAEPSLSGPKVADMEPEERASIDPMASSQVRDDEVLRPPFELNIDVVAEDAAARAIAAAAHFEPPLHVSVSVEGPTKVVTFFDDVPSQLLAQPAPKNALVAASASAAAAAEAAAPAPPVVGWDDFGGQSAPADGVAIKAPAQEQGTPGGGAEHGSVGTQSTATAAAPGSPTSAMPSKQNSGLSEDVSIGGVDIEVWLESVGLSVVTDTPMELAYGVASGVRLHVDTDDNSVLAKFEVGDLQVDNQLPHAVYPVLLWSPPTLAEARVDSRQAGGVRPVAPVIEKKPFLEVTVDRSIKPSGSIDMFKGIFCAIQPVKLSMGEEFLLRARPLWESLTQLASGRNDDDEVLGGQDGDEVAFWLPQGGASSADVKDPLRAEADAGSLPGLLASPGSAEIDRNEKVADAAINALRRVYVERLLFYPPKLTLSFATSRGASRVRAAGYTASLRTLVAIVGNVDNAELRFSALELRHAFDTSQHLSSLGAEFYVRQLRAQKLKFLTSNSLVGNPSALFDSVATGTKDFFVEAGKANSSADFLSSLGRGSSSLLTHTVGGLVGSLGSIPGSLSAGLESAVGDSEYLAKRESIRGRHASPGSGLVTGARSFGHGLSSGVAGLIRDPVAGAREDGAFGFARGLGKGLLGSVLKPVAGALDLIAEPAAGVRSMVADADARKAGVPTAAVVLRPPRAFIGANKRLASYDLRFAVGAATLAAVVRTEGRAFVQEDLVDWVELSVHVHHHSRSGVDALWKAVRHSTRFMPGSRRSSSAAPGGSSSSPSRGEEGSPTRDGQEVRRSRSGKGRERPEKTRVALLTSARLLIATLDGALLAEFALPDIADAQVRADAEADVLLGLTGRGEAGRPPQSWQRINCESRWSRDELHELLTRHVLSSYERVRCMSLARAAAGARVTAVATRPPGAGALAASASASRNVAVEMGDMSKSDATPTSAANERSSSFLAGFPLPGRSCSRSKLPTPAARSPTAGVAAATVPPAAPAATLLAAQPAAPGVVQAAVRRLVRAPASRDGVSSRSLRIIVANGLCEWHLQLRRSRLDAGVWRRPPPSAVAPGDAVVWEADSGGDADDGGRSRSLTREVRGSVTLDLLPAAAAAGGGGGGGGEPRAAGVVRLTWLNAALATNAFDVDAPRGVEVRVEGGLGGHATVVFWVVPRGGGRGSGGGRGAAAGAAAATGRTPGGSSRDLTADWRDATEAGPEEPRLFASSPSGDVTDGTGGARRVAAPAPPPPPSAEALAQLMELGFPRADAVRALRQAGGDLVRAVDLLVG
ncbi:hypothetical protein BU14_0143s0004 [Porphyra umbilicalis]|uniref:UBA domain-containing protein n=1 Tax=Porphyra umbilicalis TaxID=2786 RepID=A0A1X6P9N0_PORUM|nr:hypothetical protein BU14_0143s0004 [Porphyra umbilicalis]|eukprot:OSX77568.1 hypothetical protein BU14_0143s0004 [Porphyra umbilicalis]